MSAATIRYRWLFVDGVEILELKDIEKFSEWLYENKSFRYECDIGSVSVIRDSKGYWTASKKVDGKLRRKRLGTQEKITAESLRKTACVLCLDIMWREYQEEQQAKRRSTKPEMEKRIIRLEQTIEEQKTKIQELRQKITNQAIEIAALKYADKDDF